MLTLEIKNNTAENNTKKQTFTSDKMPGVLSRFSIKIVYIKINYFACDLRTHVTAYIVSPPYFESVYMDGII
jgi:YbbR domain-containing protein